MAALATAAVALALALGTGRLAGLAGVVALACGCVAARLVHDELVRSRREAARDRARQARDHQRLASLTAVEHARFAAAMSARVEQQDAKLGRVRSALRIALRRAEVARQRAETLQQRVASLEESLDTVLETPSVVELVGWDRRAVEVPAHADTRHA